MGTKPFLLLVMLALVAGCDSVDSSDSIDGLWRSSRTAPSGTLNDIVVFDVAAGRYDSYGIRSDNYNWSCYDNLEEGTIEQLTGSRYSFVGDWVSTAALIEVNGDAMTITGSENGNVKTLTRDRRPESALVPCE